MKSANTIFAGIVREIAAERRAQARQWGGPKHDDQHEAGDWFAYIVKQVRTAVEDRELFGNSSLFKNRSRLIKIAALAVAATESYDRKFRPKVRKCIRKPNSKKGNHGKEK